MFLLGNKSIETAIAVVFGEQGGYFIVREIVSRSILAISVNGYAVGADSH